MIGTFKKNNYSSDKLINLFGNQLPRTHLKTGLSNGSCVFKFGKGKKLFILSGVHGDERSGPLSILKYFSNLKKFQELPIEFLICPLLNTSGWDKNSRYHGKIDLNRSFHNKAPKFVTELMILLQKERPAFFLDMHEDIDEKVKYYLWVKRGKKPAFVDHIVRNTDMDSVYWHGNQKDWAFASSEDYIRSLGCYNTVTAEAYAYDDMGSRIKKNISVIDSAVEYVSKYSG
jgi:predicted deacylase